jgi:hypothetical protein
MYHIQMNTICDGWVTAWEGAEYNTFGEALEQLDEFLEEVEELMALIIVAMTIALNSLRG